MRFIATTEPFLPKIKDALSQQLLDFSLSEDLGVVDEGQGYVRVYTKAGATSWPAEWTPGGEDDFVNFEIADFLRMVAVEDQNILTYDSSGTEEVEL